MGNTSPVILWAQKGGAHMPWRSVVPMEEKIRFIGDYLNGAFSFIELCERYGISRKTGYKWVDRYVEEGIKGLDERPRRPINHPLKTPEYIEKAILEIRRKHPLWGASKVLKILSRRCPEWKLPGRTTVFNILKRNGCIEKKRRTRRRSHPGKPTTIAIGPNHLWTSDFKGQFKTRNGIYCYPLTIADAYSRYLLECKGLLSPSLNDTKKVFTKIFKEYGLPERIRTDNGIPFASSALGRLSQLSIWWIRLGIYPELIEPASPQQNGRHERMHRTLKAETTRPPASTLKDQQKQFNTFRKEFNNERPHEALGQETPASHYSHSPRSMPKKLKQLEYPGHYEVRLVSKNAGIRWRHVRVPVSHILAGEYIGLEEIDDGIWEVYYGPIWLGRFDERIMLIMDQRGRYFRRKV
jgi:putative transposase